MSLTTRQRRDRAAVDRVKPRIAMLTVVVVGAFAALFSRLWFLQVLASTDYQVLAQDNRVRLVHSEPKRGRILDRDGRVIVGNRRSLSITIDRQIVEPGSRLQFIVLKRLARLLDVPRSDLRTRLNDVTVSPYKPVAVANDVAEKHHSFIAENREDFPGVATEKLPIRAYPHGALAAHLLGYVGEISREDLASPHFRKGRHPYAAGDLVGKDGLEYVYDRFLRGRPQIERKIVNSSNEVVASDLLQEEVPGRDLVTSLDLRIQKVTEDALLAGLRAARAADFQAPAGAVVVMDPDDGAIRAMASYPEYDPAMLADGITNEEFASLGGETATGDDDAFLNRAIGALRKPGSTFKVVTAGAAMSSGVATPSSTLDCPGARVYGRITFHNWTTAHRGLIGFPESLEHSCNTFYYQLGWLMENAYGAALGDESERFQRYAQRAGLGHATGIDLRYERTGLVPDEEWCLAQQEATKDDRVPTCRFGWLPGYTVNMSIGQGDLLVTPLQMAVTYAAIANGGNVVEPRIGWAVQAPAEVATQTKRAFRAETVARLPVGRAALAVIRQGLWRVTSGAAGTARGTFAGFPLGRYPVAGKTGTAQLVSGQTDLNDAWFVSYGPKDSAKYVIAVYVEKAGHGGTSAAPIARQIWEAIAGVDARAVVRLGSDFSG
ncbi:MAG: penicillin-binding protein 2 [Actinomycetota bacterium]|nr:penicillin-binding protein 2 [Actinomycetota bacterium]